MLLVKGICSTEVPRIVAVPDLQIKGGGGGGEHPDPEILRPVWSENKGGGHLP